MLRLTQQLHRAVFEGQVCCELDCGGLIRCENRGVETWIIDCDGVVL